MFYRVDNTKTIAEKDSLENNQVIVSLVHQVQNILPVAYLEPLPVMTTWTCNFKLRMEINIHRINSKHEHQ